MNYKSKNVISNRTMVDAKDLEEDLRLLRKRILFLERELTNAEAEREDVLNSASWRITEPLRAFRRCLSRNKDQPTDDILLKKEVDTLTDPLFDVEFYRRAYPDIGGVDPFFHYSTYGELEGRLPCATDALQFDGLDNLDTARETIIIVSHEASRTGAPILALNIIGQFKTKYNVIGLLLNDGELAPVFQKDCDAVIQLNFGHSSYLVSIVLDKLLDKVDLKFAIINSIESRYALSSLAYKFVPTICLVHEFVTYMRSKYSILETVLWANEVVFSASLVRENASGYCEPLTKRPAVILPQGRCVVPANNKNNNPDTDQIGRIRKMIRPETLSDNAVAILGAGTVELRKGVDLFIACAAKVVASSPETEFRFVWVGPGFSPDIDVNYSTYLQDQIERSGLEGHICFTGEISDINIAYDLSDILFLSSRLDPLPNVAIDAMYKELPVICFDGATGIADHLKNSVIGSSCVIPYLDIERAADRLVTLIDNPEERGRVGLHIRKFAEKIFDMKSYANSLELQALQCAVEEEVERNECTIIKEAQGIVLDYFLPPNRPVVSYDNAVRIFVRTWQTGLDLRKPFPGFHPGIYENLQEETASQKNPLSDFIEKGRPKGPWFSDLILPSPLDKQDDELSLKIALHIHVFFADVFGDIYKKLEGQSVEIDLLISVPSKKVAQQVREMVQAYTVGSVDVRVVPNRGRDIGPLLAEFNEVVLDNYDIIGHLHTKKSDDVSDEKLVQNWNIFLLENLLGDNCSMASIIFDYFTNNEKLGLVFPDDPYVVGWTENKRIAKKLARELEIKNLPEHHFDFPVGNMFWARTEALKPLLTKGFTWEDYPTEPLPYDGTMLHAIERLLPFVVESVGYDVKMTHVPGLTR